MAIISIMIAIFATILLLGVILLGWKVYGWLGLSGAKVIPSLKIGLVFVATGILGIIWWSSATYISPTEVGVVENQTNGSLTTINRGLHVWPFDTNIPPIVSKVTKYSLSSRADGDNSLILGHADRIAERIASASSSEGQPVVYFWVKVVAIPDRDQLITLHRRYGKNYLNGYVGNNFESAIKTVQGRRPFDYLSGNRAEFEEEVRVELERRLGLETEGIPLVSIPFVNVLDYDYSFELNEQLNRIVAAQNLARETEALKTTAFNEAEAARNRAQGEADATAKVAEGERLAAQSRADAALYAKQREAEGIRVIQDALASSPTYIQLQQVQQWNGALPTYIGGEGPIPFFNVPSPVSAVVPTDN